MPMYLNMLLYIYLGEKQWIDIDDWYKGITKYCMLQNMSHLFVFNFVVAILWLLWTYPSITSSTRWLGCREGKYDWARRSTFLSDLDRMRLGGTFVSNRGSTAQPRGEIFWFESSHCPGIRRAQHLNANTCHAKWKWGKCVRWHSTHRSPVISAATQKINLKNFSF